MLLLLQHHAHTHTQSQFKGPREDACDQLSDDGGDDDDGPGRIAFKGPRTIAILFPPAFKWLSLVLPVAVAVSATHACTPTHTHTHRQTISVRASHTSGSCRAHARRRHARSARLCVQSCLCAHALIESGLAVWRRQGNKNRTRKDL